MAIAWGLLCGLQEIYLYAKHAYIWHEEDVFINGSQCKSDSAPANGQRRGRCYEEDWCHCKVISVLSFIQKIDCVRTKCSCHLLFVASFKKRKNVVFFSLFFVVQNILSSHMTCSSMIANDSELSQHQKWTQKVYSLWRHTQNTRKLSVSSGVSSKLFFFLCVCV